MSYRSWREISGDKQGAPLVEAALATDPPWRRSFISTLPSNVTDARTPLEILSALKTAPVPTSSTELKPYLDFLIQHKFYDLAYYTWLQFLPPDALTHAGLVFNGNFDSPPSGLPFDWTIATGSGVTIDVVPKPDNAGGHALLVAFQYGRVDYRSITQLIMLSPGDYQFSAGYQSALVGPRGLIWRVTCANATATPAGESAMIAGVSKGWKNATFNFTIPDKDCSAQYVRLDFDARSASEQLISGSALFSDVQISRPANEATGEENSGG